jgi:predicted heme/steroid binding protein
MNRTLLACILATIGFALILTAFPFHKNEKQVAVTAAPKGDVTREEPIQEVIEIPETTSTITESLPTFTKESLALYDGTDTSLPIYIAYEGNVYDVTEGKRFYEPGGAYHFLAGTDGTTMLRVAGGSIIKEKYPIVGIYRE